MPVPTINLAGFILAVVFSSLEVIFSLSIVLLVDPHWLNRFRRYKLEQLEGTMRLKSSQLPPRGGQATRERYRYSQLPGGQGDPKLKELNRMQLMMNTNN